MKRDNLDTPNQRACLLLLQGLHAGRYTLVMCSIDGCEKPPRTSREPLCNMHYFRVRRTGSAGAPEAWDRKPKACSVDECDRRAVGHGLCLNHYRHMRKGGDVDHVDSIVKYGEDNGSWRGTSVGYTAAHDRTRRRRGSARNYTCSCGAQASQWAYQHNDPNELVTPEGLPYSADSAYYTAMCVPCHKKMDLSR